MGTVKLAAALPKEPELNGLMDHSYEMLRDPRDEVIFIVRASVKTIHDGQWDGTRVPELGILAVEMPVGEDADNARRIMGREKDRRYARKQLPWEEPGTLGGADRARYGAAGMLKHGSGLHVGRVDPESGEVDDGERQDGDG
jgi:hypothetical protein